MRLCKLSSIQVAAFVFSKDSESYSTRKLESPKAKNEEVNCLKLTQTQLNKPEVEAEGLQLSKMERDAGKDEKLSSVK